MQEACLIITGYIFRFNLSKIAAKELIKLINLLLPSKSKIPKTYKRNLSFLNIKETSFVEKHYCNSCGNDLKEKLCVNIECS